MDTENSKKMFDEVNHKLKNIEGELHYIFSTIILRNSIF